MGFGYNPTLTKFGERLDMLDFFAWMKRWQSQGLVDRWIIWDAASYAIVNKVPPLSLERLGTNPSARKVLEYLVEEQERQYVLSSQTYERNEQEKFRLNCRLRSYYLQRLNIVTGVNGEYLDARRIFREDRAFENSLDKALEFTRRLRRDNPELVRKIEPEKATPPAQLYLPLEIAEALYLQQTRGIEGKFGPCTEEYFDQSIILLQEELGKSYATIRCPLPPGELKPAYLFTRSSDILYTSGLLKAKTIRRLLRRSPGYQEFVEFYLAPFQKPTEGAVPCLQRLAVELRGERR